jgi:FkbM family methyltransferase
VTRVFEAFRTARGVLRSLRIYYGGRHNRAAMDALYARFVKPGDLVFDVGSHVGDRIAAFRRLGARVVACEPNPPLVKTLRLIYGRDAQVTVEPVAVGAAPGEIEMRINVDNPTVSTASKDFLKASQGAEGWQDQVWDKSIKVAVTTLDGLIARHGLPAFMKIDVEGFEAEALAGLTQPVQALSFEFTTIQRDVAHACVRRCAELGYARYNAALGESQQMVHDSWQSAEAIGQWLGALPMSANSGDVYAMR